MSEDLFGILFFQRLICKYISDTQAFFFEAFCLAYMEAATKSWEHPVKGVLQKQLFVENVVIHYNFFMKNIQRNSIL